MTACLSIERVERKKTITLLSITAEGIDDAHNF